MKKNLIFLFTFLIFISKTYIFENSNLLNNTVDSAFVETSLEITELYPNPEGPDYGKEWIELYNNSPYPINLTNWEIHNHNRSMQLPENITIAPYNFFIIQKEDMKIILRNISDTITLINPQKQIINKIKYETAPEAVSLSKVKIFGKNTIQTKWIWTTPTKGKKNPNFYIIKGKVISPKSSTEKNDDKVYPNSYISGHNLNLTNTENFEKFFKIKDKNENISKIFIPENFNKNILNLIIKENNFIKITAKKTNNNYILKEIKFENKKNFLQETTPHQKINWFEKIVIFISIIFLGFLLWFKKTFIKPYL